MSDNRSYGEPIEETDHRGDSVIDSANDSLAEAEAARREPVTADTSTVDEPVFESVVDDTTVAEPAGATAASPQSDDVPRAETPVDTTPSYETPAHERADAASSRDDDFDASIYESPAALSPEYSSSAASAPAAGAPAYTAPTYETPAAAASPQPIFVQAPEAPTPRGNRGAVAAIGLLAAVVFGILYLAVWIGIDALNGRVTLDNVGTAAGLALTSFSLWIPVAAFFLGFLILGSLINRGAWGHWVVWGIFVGLAAYVGHILGALFQAPFWQLTGSEGADLVRGELLAPLAIAAFVIGRELTIWFGAWVASRGRKVSELNAESQREYERTLEAGPQLYGS